MILVRDLSSIRKHMVCHRSQNLMMFISCLNLTSTTLDIISQALLKRKLNPRTSMIMTAKINGSGSAKELIQILDTMMYIL